MNRFTIAILLLADPGRLHADKFLSQDSFAGLARQDSRWLGRPDDRRELRRSYRIQDAGQDNDGPLEAWTPDRVSNSLGQDDLYVDMTFAKVLDDKGLDATSDDFGAMFRDAKYDLWHANLAARRNLKRGVPAALAGSPKYNAHANDIDFQIEADFIGLMAPGLPRASNEIAWRAGRVMNYGDGIYGGMFVSCMYAAAIHRDRSAEDCRSGLRLSATAESLRHNCL